MKIYVSGPITKGDQFENARKAIHVGVELVKLGHTPFVPHLFCFVHLVETIPYEDWLRQEFEWIEVCDAVIRIPGESPGADREVQFALGNGVPVFDGLGDFLSNGNT